MENAEPQTREAVNVGRKGERTGRRTSAEVRVGVGTTTIC